MKNGLESQRGISVSHTNILNIVQSRGRRREPCFLTKKHYTIIRVLKVKSNNNLWFSFTVSEVMKPNEDISKTLIGFLFLYLFVSSWHVDIVPYLLSSTSYQVCSGVYSVHDFYLCPRVSHKTDVSGLWLCCRVLCRGPIPQYCYYLTPSSL